MNKVKKNKIIVLGLAVIMGLSTGCEKTVEDTEEEIVFGDIDFDAEETEIVRPHSIVKSNYIVGTTALNLMQGGYFCESDDYLFYVINYNSEDYLVRVNKNTDEKDRIYKGTIRNLFIFDNWVYGIETEGSIERMITFDVNGNNVYKSDDFKYTVRTMMSDGERIYFTVDASNLLGNSINTAIYSYAMDFTDLKTEKETYNTFSQIDLLNIYNGRYYFYEESSAEDEDNFIYLSATKESQPVFYNGRIYVFDSIQIENLTGCEYKVNAVNMLDDIVYISVSDEKNHIMKLDLSEGTYETNDVENKVTGIYSYSDGLIYQEDNYFEKIN
jgi:hypothetical protein